LDDGILLVYLLIIILVCSGATHKLARLRMTDFRVMVPYVGQALFLLIRRHHFFELISFRMSIDNCWSATLFFNLAFSCSSSLARVSSDRLIPPYLDFQL